MLEHGRLTGVDRLRLGAAETEAKGQVAWLGGLVDSTWILRHIKARNTDRSRRAGGFPSFG